MFYIDVIKGLMGAFSARMALAHVWLPNPLTPAPDNRYHLVGKIQAILLTVVLR